jgi:hypothetical protein
MQSTYIPVAWAQVVAHHRHRQLIGDGDSGALAASRTYEGATLSMDTSSAEQSQQNGLSESLDAHENDQLVARGLSTAVPVSTSVLLGTATLKQKSRPMAIGVYAGNQNVAGVASFASATGADVTMAEVYLPWQAYTGPSYGNQTGWGYLTTKATLAHWLSGWARTSYQMVIGLPMVALNKSGEPENTLAQGADGDDDSYFVSIARNLVSLGFSNAILRPGWEFDGFWYPWSVNGNREASEFAAYFRHIVVAMRSVPGANFHFVWNPTGFQSLPWNINYSYPGNAYVDFVSLDVYDWAWNASNRQQIFRPTGIPDNLTSPAQSKEVFRSIQSEPEGLNWLVGFAGRHQKAIAIPEWAVSTRTDSYGLGDDPTFINNMFRWIAYHRVSWSVYFVDNRADNARQGLDLLLTDGKFPRSLAAFRRDADAH